MAREDLVSSAVTFLSDPSVSASPIDKRIAFLQSKNLTQEEIDLALARAGEEPSSAPPPAPSNYTAPRQVYQQQPQVPGAGYGYGQYGGWQPPPPEVPKRDWRDWFIMATVMGGVSYGLYVVAKRYIAPIVSPPTPPKLQQDKEAIDAEFTRAFTLLDQLSADTASLKVAEESRTEKLDAALREVENVVSELKNASRRREDEGRRISEEVRNLKEQIPKALEGAKEGSDKRLKELGAELRSLKTLMGNRLGTGATPTPTSNQPARTAVGYPGAGNVLGSSSSPSLPREKEETPAPVNATTTETPVGASNPTTSPTAAMQPSVQSPRREGNASPFPSSGSTARAIPAWQMAAAKKSAGTSAGPPEVADATESDSQSGTAA